jgi:ribose-phosphate pyrophosphokinase
VSPNDGHLKIFTGTATPDLAKEIAAHLGIQMGRLDVGRFSNGEIKVTVDESVRGHDIFVVQSMCDPVNDAIMELLIIIDAMRRASAKRITAVVPHYGYARQDRKTRGREPITAKLVANLLTTAGVNRVLTVDLHAGQIQGFFDIPVDHLSAAPILGDYFIEKGLENAVVVAPDIGGVQRARDMAEVLGASIAIIDKRRPEPGMCEVVNIIGRVQGKAAIMIDDIIDTGGTIINGSRALLEKGAREVYACCSHPIFSGQALKHLSSSEVEELVVTNTVPLKRSCGKVRVLSVAHLLGEAIERIHQDQSVSEMFKVVWRD